MKSLKKEIKDLSQNHLVYDEKKVLETISKSKQALYKNETEQFLSYPQFIYQQSIYIHKRWWVLQGFLLLVLWWFLQISESNFYIQRSMGILAPLFVILIVPELWKNKMHDSSEIECTAYYSLRQVYAARMILFAIVDLLLLSLFFIVVSFTVQITIEAILIQFFIPFNVTCCICFRSLYSQKTGREYFSLLLCMVWIAVWVQIVLNDKIYTAISVPAWGCMIVLSVLYLGYSTLKVWNNCEKIWEENPSWN